MSKNIKERFDELKTAWLEETKNYSRTTHIIGHPAYEDIFEMGSDVLPFIIEELKKELKSDPSTVHNWFFALYKLTNENPVPKDEWGNFEKMARRWVDWSEKVLKKEEFEKANS